MKTTTTVVEIRPAVAAVTEKRTVLELTQRELLLIAGALGAATPGGVKSVVEGRGFVLGDIDAVSRDMYPLFTDALKAATDSTKK